VDTSPACAFRSTSCGDKSATLNESILNSRAPGSNGRLENHLQYNEGVVKLEIEVNIADDVADKVELQERLRREAILTLFADRKITAGKAAHELGLERLAFMQLLKQRGVPDIIYTAEDWEADARAIDELTRRRKIG
jgi:predicted HTH domain antitoxin